MNSRRRLSARLATLWGRPLAVVFVAAEKALTGLGAAVAGSVILVLHHQGALNRIFPAISEELSEDPDNIALRWLARHLPHIAPGIALWMAVGLLFWGLLLATEAYGLWRDLAWGEFLVVVETASFLPVEVWDIFGRGQPLGVVSLIVNLLILAYVGRLWRRHGRRQIWAAPLHTASGRDDGEPPTS